jgi:UDP-glucose 4-epimerase
MAKRVLLTGAFGNIGSLVIRELLAQGYDVIACDKPGDVTRKNARKFSDPRIRIAWGDITVKSDVDAAMQGADAVIHLAGIFPPLSETNPDLAFAVNVQGTRHIVEAMEASPTAKRLAFASSIAVYGKQQGKFKPPLTADDPVAPDDNYGQHKAECEQIIRASSLQWTLMRIGACPPVNVDNMASFKDAPLFESHPDSQLEVIHPADTALAFVNALACDEAIGKTLLLGGGERNRTTCYQLMNDMFGSIGLGPLPRETFQLKEPIDFHGDWIDTEESQRLLKFQRHTIAQLHHDFWHSLGAARHALWLLRPIAPLVTWAIARSSPYYRQQHCNTKRQYTK